MKNPGYAGGYLFHAIGLKNEVVLIELLVHQIMIFAF